MKRSATILLLGLVAVTAQGVAASATTPLALDRAIGRAMEPAEDASALVGSSTLYLLAAAAIGAALLITLSDDDSADEDADPLSP